MLSIKKQQAYSGIFWNTLEKGGNQVFFFITNIFLARMLVPSDFGLLGMIVVFTAVAQSFVDSGFTSALIQRENATDEDFSTVFYFNIFIAFVFSIVIFFLAPSISDFYHEPRLLNITRLMSLNLVINALGMIQIVKFTKEIDFRSLTKVNLTAIICSGLISILFAFYGFGYWSLVIKSVLNSMFTTILLWRMSPWRPRLIFSLKSISSLFSFGSRLLLSGLLYKIFSYIYNVIIGKYYSAKDLGYFTQAQQLQQIPVMNLTSIFSTVSYPLLSSMQSDEDSLKKGFRKTINVINMINFPMMIGMLVVADSMIISIFTLKWANTIPLLRLLCVSGLLFPISAISLNAINAKGRSDIFLKLEIVKQFLMIISILVTIKHGINALLIGGMIVSFLGYLLNMYFTTKLIKYSLIEHFKDILPTFISAGIMGGIVYLCGFLMSEKTLVRLVFQTIIGVIAYLILIAIFKIEALREIKDLLRNIKMKVLRGQNK